MKWHELLNAYLKSLFNHWYILIFGLFDVIGVILEDWIEWSLPKWAYGWIFIVVFGIANILVYRDCVSGCQTQKRRLHEEIKSLQTKLDEITNALPSLSLHFFENGQTSSHQILYFDEIPEEPDINELVEQEIAEVRETYQALKDNDGRKQIEGTENIYYTFQVPDDATFEEILADYASKYKNYLERSYLYELGQSRFRKLRFVLKNAGRTPAEDIRIFIFFPKEFKIFDRYDPDEEDELDLDILSTPPQEPPRPLTKSPKPSLLELVGRSLYKPPAIPSSLAWTPPDVSRPDGGPFVEKKDDITIVKYVLDKLLHNFSYSNFRSLEFFYAGEIAYAFHIRYEIHAANLLQPQEGTLILEFQRQSAA